MVNGPYSIEVCVDGVWLQWPATHSFFDKAKAVVSRLEAQGFLARIVSVEPKEVYRSR